MTPFVKVVASVDYTTKHHPRGTSSRMLQLECGHYLRRKGSQPIPKHAHCGNCADLAPRRCRVCGCTNDDCHACIERTGGPCYWVEDDLCSACVGRMTAKRK